MTRQKLLGEGNDPHCYLFRSSITEKREMTVYVKGLAVVRFVYLLGGRQHGLGRRGDSRPDAAQRVALEDLGHFLVPCGEGVVVSRRKRHDNLWDGSASITCRSPSLVGP